MSLAVGDNVFVNAMHPAKIIAFLDNNRCEVAWANGCPHSTVVLLGSVTSMFAQRTRLRCAPQTYFEQTSAQAKLEMRATKKPVVKVKRERAPAARVGRKKRTNEPQKKRKRTNEPLSRREAAAQVATALKSRDNKRAARKTRVLARSTEVPAAKPNRAKVSAEAGIDMKRAAKPTKKRHDNKPGDDVDDYESSDTDQLLSQVYKKQSDLLLAISNESDDSSLDVKIKVEDDSSPRPSSFTFQIGDNVWVKDGKTDHAAQVIGVFENLYQIKWSSTDRKTIVEKSRVTSMDLTLGLDDGRRRRRQRQCEAIKKESEAKKPARQKLKPGSRKKRSKAPVAAAASVKSTVFTTNGTASSQICLDDDESGAESQGTDATFEYTGQRVDPLYRSRHVISSMELFMSKESRRQPPAEGSCDKKKDDKKKDGDRSASICGVAEGDAPCRRAPIPIEEYPKLSQATHYPKVSAEQLGLDVARSVNDTPSIRGPHLAASCSSSPSSPTEAKSVDLNESTETANPDEIPLVDSDERRLTADPAEMSQMFAYI